MFISVVPTPFKEESQGFEKKGTEMDSELVRSKKRGRNDN